MISENLQFLNKTRTYLYEFENFDHPLEFLTDSLSLLLTRDLISFLTHLPLFSFCYSIIVFIIGNSERDLAKGRKSILLLIQTVTDTLCLSFISGSLCRICIRHLSDICYSSSALLRLANIVGILRKETSEPPFCTAAHGLSKRFRHRQCGGDIPTRSLSIFLLMILNEFIRSL